MNIADAPRVSLIVRTTGRPELRRALTSIAQQIQQPVEIVLVHARAGLDTGEAVDGLDTLRVVTTDHPLDRPHAANAGLDAASGDWLGFLDEDDWLDASHLDGLIGALGQASGYLLAYADMVVHAGAPEPRLHDRGYWKRSFAESPVVSMNSALFSRKLVDDHGCRFDPRFALLEDWDFFVQCAEFTDFLHVPQPTAHYDSQAGSSGGGLGANRDDERIKPYLELMTRKWGIRYAQLADAAARALALADQARHRQDWHGVRDAAMDGLGADPGNPALLNRLALAWRQLGDPMNALWAIRRACDSDRSSFSLRADLAVLEKQAGFQQRAQVTLAQMRALANTAADHEKVGVVEAFLGR